MPDSVKILKDCKFDNVIINKEEGRKFIIEIVDFFVNKVIEETEGNRSISTDSEKALEKRYYKDYKFIRDSISPSSSPKGLYYVLIRKAAVYIDFIEDGINHNVEFPLNILSMFELTSWFENNIDRYRTDAVMIALINKLFNSIYRTIFI